VQWTRIERTGTAVNVTSAVSLVNSYSLTRRLAEEIKLTLRRQR